MIDRRIRMSTMWLYRLFNRHHIDPADWVRFSALVFFGTRPSDELLTKLRHDDDYIACLVDVMQELPHPRTIRVRAKQD